MDLSYQLYATCDRCREGQMQDYDNLCYYHQKVVDGLIDEPPMEIAYIDRNRQSDDQLEIFMSTLSFILNNMVQPEHRDDASSYVGLTFNKMLADWKPEAGTWRTFCDRHIKNQILNFLKKENLHKERYVIMPDSNDGDILVDWDNPEQTLLDNEDRQKLLEYIVMKAPDRTPLEAVILWSRLLADDPVSLRKLAERHGMSAEGVRQVELKFIDRIREAVIND